jgi:hypothetical protein
MDDNAIDAERLRRATADVDEQHHAAMRSIEDGAAGRPDVTDETGADADDLADRRQFLRRVGVGGAAVAVGAGGISLAALLPAGAQSTATATITDGDTPIIVFAQSAELALASLYLTAIATNKLSAALSETARTFGLHHGEHATALATLADKAATNKANPTLVAQFEPQIKDATSEDALVRVLFDLEQAAAATYESALGKLETTFTAGPVSTILPIEGQQAVVWGQVLELPIDQWLPPFQSESDALDAAKYPS